MLLAFSAALGVPDTKAVAELCDRLPEQCELWLGGCASAALVPETLPRACVCLREPGDLRARARALCAP